MVRHPHVVAFVVGATVGAAAFTGWAVFRPYRTRLWVP